VAFADPAAGLAFRQSWPQPLGGRQSPALHGGQDVEVGGIGQQRASVGKIVQHRSANSFRGAERRSGVGRDRVMKSREPPGQGIHVPVFQPAGGQHPVQQRFLGKAAHADGVFDDFPGGAKDWLTDATADRHAIEIQIRR